MTKRAGFKDQAGRIHELRERIAELHAEGHSRNDISAILGLCAPGVGYHTKAMGLTFRSKGYWARRDVLTGETCGKDQAGYIRNLRTLIAEAHAQGLRRTEIAEQLRVAVSVVAYHARSLGLSFMPGRRIGDKFETIGDRIAKRLAASAGTVVSGECLAAAAYWDRAAADMPTHWRTSINAVISRLRSKGMPIETFPGEGYRLPRLQMAAE